MNKAQFCDELCYGSGLKRDLAEKVRDVTAILCKLDSDVIEPGTDNDYLCSKMRDGWDEVEFLIKMEEALNTEIPDIRLPNFTISRFFFFYKKAKPLNYGEWVKSVVEVIAPIIEQRTKEKGT
jgi:hypothetical protein